MKIKVRNQIPTGYKKPTAAFTPTEAPPSPTSNPPSLGELSDDDLVPLPPTPRHLRRKQVIDDDLDAKPEQVQVFVRMRPADVNPTANNHVNIHKKHHLYDINKPTNTITLSSNHPLVEKRSAGTPTRHSKNSDFTFDSLLLPPARTCSLYDSHITKLIHSSMAGYNSTVFAYGQTGSGKTHTLTGTEDEPGIIPLAVEQVFEEIYDDPTREFLLRVRYLEIYNEKLRDLLGPATQNEELRVREDKSGNTFVENLTEVLVTTPQEVLALKDQGDMNRHVGATDWNDRSSRSHCVFQIVVESSERQSNLTKHSVSRKSTLNLIDLAGSEKATTDTSRRLEGSNINKSLLALSTVISEIVKTPKPTHIPFRNSKLTYLLKPSLSGDARVGVVCTIADGMEHHNATLDTLKFARTIKKVKIQAKRGDILDGTKDALLQQHITQIKILQKEVASLESNKYEEIRHAIAEERAANDEKVFYQNNQIDQLKKELDDARKLVLNSTSIDGEDISHRRQSQLRHGQSRRLSDMGLGVSAPGFSVPQSKRRVLSTGIPVSTDENDEFEARLREKEEEVEALRTQLEEIRIEQSELTSRFEDLKNTTQEDSTASSNLREEIDKAKAENDELHNRLSQTLEQLKQAMILQKEQAEKDLNSSQDFEDLRSEFDNLQSARQDDELRLSSLESQNEMLKDDLKMAAEKKETLENEMKEFESERDSLFERQKLLEAETRGNAEKIEKLEQDAKKKDNDYENAIKEKDTLLGKLSTLEKDIATIRDALKTAEAAQEKIAKERDSYMEDSIKALEAQKQAEKERDNYKENTTKAIQAQEEAEKARDSHREELNVAVNARQEAEKERDSHKEASSKALQGQKDAEKERDSYMEDKSKALQAQKEAEKVRDHHEKELVAAINARDIVQKERDSYKDDITKAAQAQKEAEESRKLAEKERDEHKDEHGVTKSTLLALQDSHDSFKTKKEEEIAYLRETHEELQKSYDILKDTLTKFRMDMQAEADEHKREVNVLLEDANKLKKDKDESEKERQQLKNELQERTKELNEYKSRNEERDGEHTSLKAQVAELLAEKEALRHESNSLGDSHKREIETMRSSHEDVLSKLQQELKSATEAQTAARKESEEEMATLINNRAEEDVELQERLSTAERESNDARGMATKLTSTIVERDSTIKELEAKVEELSNRQDMTEQNEGFGQVHIAKRMEEYVELQDRVSELNNVIQKQASEISKLKARPLPLPQPTQSPSQSRVSSESTAIRRLFDRASSPNLRAKSTPLTKADDGEMDKLNDVIIIGIGKTSNASKHHSSTQRTFQSIFNGNAF
ncbi:kinesin-domain-containing protein [Wallemia mellicola]|nr:kinesin-domain-containing protein [Wallemia mellicola]